MNKILSWKQDVSGKSILTYKPSSQEVTLRGIVRNIRRFFATRRLTAIERQLDLIRRDRAEAFATEAYLQREAAFLNCDLAR